MSGTQNRFHILNGDALRGQFPAQIQGERIVVRECLVDGPVGEDSLEDLFKMRAEFIARGYNGFTKDDYYEETVPEFNRIRQIPSGSEISLWFEDDLFCQVNLWFVCSLLEDHTEYCVINLVRPNEQNRYNFAGLNDNDLLFVFKNREKLTGIEQLAKLRKLYQQQKVDELLGIGKELKSDLPFLLPAIQAHIDRIPSNGRPGRPVEALIEIQKELKTTDFGAIFREFAKRESIYGFGDLQVKRLLYDIQEY